MKNITLLNKVKDMIIAKANKDGRSLKDDFGTKEKFKDFVIAFTIRSLVEVIGMTTKEAFDTVMGDGEYQRLADDCWNSLQAS